MVRHDIAKRQAIRAREMGAKLKKDARIFNSMKGFRSVKSFHKLAESLSKRQYRRAQYYDKVGATALSNLAVIDN